MLFNSFVFAGLFLPVVLALFWSMPSAAAKRWVLILGSLVFYGYWFPIYLLLLLGFVVVAWWSALRIEQTGSSWPLYFAAFVLFGGLAFFKYAGFIGQIAVDVGMAAGDFSIVQLALPLGISFIVFQSMGYVIDVSRKQFPAEKRLDVVLLFKSFFPQLIAGPICRGHELMPQLKGQFDFRLTQFCSGLAIFALGMLIKEFFADGLSPLVDKLFVVQQSYTLEIAWAASIGFGAQIYADFWGYSTMAVGLARMFAIDIPTNFNLPYVSTSLREFWRRWHITLSQWLRDYLYKTLGGSRRGRYRTIQALLATMLLGGLWHGANYTFIIWGSIHGVALVLEHTFIKRRADPVPGLYLSLPGTIGFLYTFLIVFIAWVFFRSTNVDQALQIVQAMFSVTSSNFSAVPIEVKQIAFMAGAVVMTQFPIERLLRRLRTERTSPNSAIAIAFGAMIAVIVLGAPVAVPFIYFQF